MKIQFLALAALAALSSCGEPAPAEQVAEPTPPPTAEATPTEVAPLIITEDVCLNIPMDHAHHVAAHRKEPAPVRAANEPYVTVMHTHLDSALVLQEHAPVAPRLVSAHIMPPHKELMDVKETDQVTLIAYEKKGVEAMHIVTDPMDPKHVQHVAFLHKDHVDQYNVRPGMKGHEARKLRHELKHMARKGHVFLYSEESNIVYRMRVVDPAKADYTMEEVENLEVEAIIWRNKHHKHQKNA